MKRFTNKDLIPWLFKVNPRLIELLDRFVRVLEMEKEKAEENLQVMENSRAKNHPAGGLLSVADAAQRLCVSMHTLRGWVTNAECLM